MKKNEMIDKENTLQKENEDLRLLNQKLISDNEKKEEQIKYVMKMCDNYSTGKMMRINRLISRFINQFFWGNIIQKKCFISWISGYRLYRNIEEESTFVDPWLNVKEQLSLLISYQNQGCEKNSNDFDNVVENRLNGVTVEELGKCYDKYDVIILSVIDYNFRYQRPQHFASRYAEDGHRVFYINANFIRPYTVNVVDRNLYSVDFSSDNNKAIYETDFRNNKQWLFESFDKFISLYAIRDAEVIVDYPNWIVGSLYLRQKYGFKIVTDYMDDYTGFLGTAESFLKRNCIELLEKSDLVITSSQFLNDIAIQYADISKVSVIRNGAEVSLFKTALEFDNKKKNKVIGYYGAVAHWFAWEKVCYLAKELPDCDIVIIGEVTEYKEKLRKYKNIKMLGEMCYKELPKHLSYFDVCLIPFDTSTDLIKATNPVKFYEYLSAGKKIVATEIPELMPYRDKYVYMSNDDEKFLAYVKLCLEKSDCLNSSDECIRFAMQNDWRERYQTLVSKYECCIPKISIVVLTYNNEEMNRKCIDSILNSTAYGNFELIIVDNNSTDSTIEFLLELRKENLDNVKIIFNKDNIGFAGGNNVGIRASNGEYIVLLNSDTIVSRGWLTNLVKHIENDTNYAMCNPVTNSIGNESQIISQYNGMDEYQEFAYYYTDKHMGQEYRNVDRIPLFSTIISKKVIDEIGFLDESFELGMFEDDDYTERVRNAGYRIIIAEDVFIHHINNGSFKKLDSKIYKKVFDENKKKYETKWNKKWTMPQYRPEVQAKPINRCIIN